LDTRPPELHRSTIHQAWMQRCPTCGYCASDVSKSQPRFRHLVGSPEYAAQLEDIDYPDLANSFLCRSMIDEYAGDLAAATWALIHAAWICDDAERECQAVSCRRRAAAMLRRARANGQSISAQRGAGTAILVDLLRRVGQLDDARQAIREGRDASFEDAITQILNCQSALVNVGDLSCHLVPEAFGGEADP